MSVDDFQNAAIIVISFGLVVVSLALLAHILSDWRK